MWGPRHASPVTGALPISWQGLWWAVPSQCTEEEAQVPRPSSWPEVLELGLGREDSNLGSI